MSAPILEPLPSLIELGRSLGAVSAAERLLDEATTAGKPTPIELDRMNVLYRQHEALQELISTMPAMTLGGVAVQLGVAFELASHLDGSDWSGPPGQQDRLDRLHGAIFRITISALPVVAKAAGLDMAVMGWESAAALRAHHFGLEGAK